MPKAMFDPLYEGYKWIQSLKSKPKPKPKVKSKAKLKPKPKNYQPRKKSKIQQLREADDWTKDN